jgi:hypothetical protein
VLFCYVLILAIGIHSRPLVLNLKKLRAWILENAKSILLVAKVTYNRKFLLTKYWFFRKDTIAHIFKHRQNKTKEFTSVLSLLSNSALRSSWRKWLFYQNKLKWILRKNHRDPLRRYAVEAVFNFDIFNVLLKINNYLFSFHKKWICKFIMNIRSFQNIIWR